MIFISSLTPLQDIPSTKDQIINNDWFLFSSGVRNKAIRFDNELYHMCNRLYWYPFFYRDTLYNYLMSDNYYYKSNLYKTMKNISQMICMRRIDKYEDIKHDKTIDDKTKRFQLRDLTVKEKDMIFKKDDIYKMFDAFTKNNFRQNQICEYIMPY